MLDRRIFLTTVAGLLAAPLVAEAQKSEKIARVGILDIGRGPGPGDWALGSFSQATREVGWIEGRNLVVERRFGESADQLHASAAELGANLKTAKALGLTIPPSLLERAEYVIE